MRWGGESGVKRERDGRVMKGKIWLKWGENEDEEGPRVPESPVEAEITSWGKLHIPPPVSSAAFTI